jgi:hypothetical protein
MEVIVEFGIWETYDELATLPRKCSLHTNLTPKRKANYYKRKKIKQCAQCFIRKRSLLKQKMLISRKHKCCGQYKLK